MTTTLKMKMDALPPARRAQVKAQAKALIAEEMTLRDLRKACDLTQERMAELLHVGQDSVSRLEQRTDLLLSTLRGYVVAMGGTLDLVARFPDRPVVILGGLADISPAKIPGKKPVARSRNMSEMAR
jgi:hypothetical protein